MRRFLHSSERRTTPSENRAVKRIVTAVLQAGFVPRTAEPASVDQVLSSVQRWARRWDEAVAGVWYRCVRLRSTKHAVVPFLRLALADLATRIGAVVDLRALPDALARGSWRFEGQRCVFIEALVKHAGMGKYELMKARAVPFSRSTVKSWFGVKAKRPSPEHLEDLARFLAPRCEYDSWRGLFAELQWYYTLADLVQMGRRSLIIEEDHLHEARHCMLVLANRTRLVLESLLSGDEAHTVRRALVARGAAALPDQFLHSLCESMREKDNAHCLWGAAVWGGAHDWASWLRLAFGQFLEGPFSGGSSAEELDYARWVAPIAQLSLRVFDHADTIRAMNARQPVEHRDALDAHGEIGHIARCYYVAGEYEKAGPLFHWQLGHSPSDDVTCFCWIDCLWRSCRLDTAEEAARALCERSPTYTGGRHLLAEVLLETNRAAEALALIESHVPEFPSWEWYVLHARTLTELGRYEDALEALSRLLPLEDPPVAVLELSSECHARLGGREHRNQARQLAKLARDMGLDRMAAKLEAREI